MARIGLVPGKDYDPSQARLRSIGRCLKAVPKLALVEMGIHLKRQKTTNGWLFFTKGVGNFGTDYLTRGMANLLGPGWNRPQDAVYPLSQKDAKGDAYDGAKHNYVVRFEKGQLPPADAFWSLTMYDERLLLRAQRRSTATTSRSATSWSPTRTARSTCTCRRNRPARTRRPTGCRRPRASSSS